MSSVLLSLRRTAQWQHPTYRTSPDGSPPKISPPEISHLNARVAEACGEHCSAHPSRPCASEYHASCLSQERGEVGVAVAIRE